LFESIEFKKSNEKNDDEVVEEIFSSCFIVGRDHGANQKNKRAVIRIMVLPAS